MARDPLDPPGSSFRVAIPPELRQLLNDLATNIAEEMPEGFGFGLFLFEYGDKGSMFWISSANRDDMAKALSEWIHREGS